MAAGGAPRSSARTSVAVVGAGWAGLACAVTLVEAGCRVSVFEAGKAPGGRARSVAGDDALGTVDNGQHVLIGPYRETFALMDRLGVDRRQVLRRLPLALRATDGLRLHVPAWPLGLGTLAGLLGTLAGLLGARGLGPGGRRALLRVARGVQAMLAAPDRTVAAWLGEMRQPDELAHRLWAPLCVAALNTPAERASARVFARVLHDGLLTAGATASIEVPARPLGELLPEPALAWLRAQGAEVRLGERVTGLDRDAVSEGTLGGAVSEGTLASDTTASVRGAMGLFSDTAAATTPKESSAASVSQRDVCGAPSKGASAGWHVGTLRGCAGPFDAVVVAVAPHQAAALIEPHADVATLARLRGLEYEAIATVHLRLATPLPTMSGPLLLLHDGPGEWLIDHGDGRASVVVSAWRPNLLSATDRQDCERTSANTFDTPTAALDAAVRAQLQRLFPAQPAVVASRTLVEKRATFACTPGLQRPGHTTGAAGLWL
ncbi:MAG: hypothetical protein FGM40_05330, partial [Rhodocyclaceae bacterium]|nr:hypothetical protein [Rhodocyclaceae bacterium]